MIRLQDITVAYGPRVILNHINLDIHDGETLGILGASGSGKSTILRLIIGLQKPSGGHIFIDGQDITDFTEDEPPLHKRTIFGISQKNQNRHSGYFSDNRYYCRLPWRDGRRFP